MHKRVTLLLAAVVAVGFVARPTAAESPAEHPPAAKTLTVAAVSMESQSRKTELNLDRIELWARRASKAGANLVLFPEAALSSWWQSREIRKYAEPADGPSIQRLIKLAGELDIVIAVGMTERDGDRAYITHVLIDGHGVIGKHRKSSLAGGVTGEGKVWDAGHDANVFDVRGTKIGVAICFESVEPETCKQLTANGAKIILAPYSNGTDPDELTNGKRPYPAARAKENHVWYVACDAPPHRDGGGVARGAAYVIDPTGRLVAITAADATGENMVVYTIPRD